VIEVVVSGARGRLGSRICALVREAPDLKLAGELEYDTPDRSSITKGRVLIEAATKAAAIEDAAIAAREGAAILVATTGFDARERAALEAHAAKVPLMIAPNLSLGVAVLLDLVARASAALPSYDLEILELHHNKKKDAPSGTAWALGRAAAEARGRDVEQDAILARAGETGARGKDEIGMQSIRGGDIVGDHTVFLVGGTERLELTHRAQTRDTFAAGAVHAARFLAAPERRPGLYTMRHVLGLDPQR
jgi:4-hydroxy-tetrahydrodipicolinate reductase